MLIPGNVAGVAKQFLRCMFHQLAPNGIFPQLFQSNIKGLLIPLTAKVKNLDQNQKGFIAICARNHNIRKLLQYLLNYFSSFSFADGSFLRTLASSLIDFNELSSVAALNMLLEVGFC